LSVFEAPNLLDQFTRSLVKDKVGIVEFCESDRYCNKPLFPRQRVLLKTIFLEELDGYEEDVLSSWVRGEGDVNISPNIRARVQWLRDNGYPHFRRIQLVGGRRSGKGYMTALAIAKKIYELTQIDNVGDYFGVPRGKAVEFMVLAAAKEQAKTRQFADIENVLMDCVPLIENKLLGEFQAETIFVNTPYDLRRHAMLKASGTRISKNLASLHITTYGANAKTLRGPAAIVCVMDEMAHLLAGESRSSDTELYKAIVPSLMQFKQYAMMFLNSSPYTKQGRFFEIYEESLRVDDNNMPLFPDLFMIQYPSWEMYRDWQRQPHKHPVGALLGSPEDGDQEMLLEEKADPDSFRVEYRAHFAEVIDAFLDPQAVDRMFDPDFTLEKMGRPLIPQEGGINYYTYKMHCDPAATGANFGIAIGHLEEIKREDDSIEPHVVIDFINAFRPEDFKTETNPGAIDWLTVIPALQELCINFQPYEVSFDQYESLATIDILREGLRQRGFTNIHMTKIHASPKINTDRAKVFKAALNLGRVHAPHPLTYSGGAPVTFNPIQLVKDELKFLQEKNGRVDKQMIGPIQTKDIADCVMEVTKALIGDRLANERAALTQSAQLGALGGYAANNTTYRSNGTPLEGWYSRREGRGVYVPGRGMRRGR
jgi:hypothetical protein